MGKRGSMGKISVREVLHEANFLKLDCSRIRNRLGWKPRWQVDEAVVNTAKWYQAWLAGQNMAEYTDCQIKEYFGI